MYLRWNIFNISFKTENELQFKIQGESSIKSDRIIFQSNGM